MLNRGSCDRRLHKAFLALSVLANQPEVGRYLGIEGPDSPVLQRGWALFRAAESALNARQNKEGLAIEAIARCGVAFQAARVLQARLTLLARVMITRPSDRDRLGLTGRRPEALGAWRMQAQLFHTNLRAEDRELLAEVGVDEALLSRAAGLISQLEADHAACIEAKAEARRATETKMAAFEALAAFMSRLITMARGLETEVPFLVEKLGMSRDARRNRDRLKATPAEVEPEPEPEAGAGTAADLERVNVDASDLSTAVGSLKASGIPISPHPRCNPGISPIGSVRRRFKQWKHRWKR